MSKEARAARGRITSTDAGDGGEGGPSGAFPMHVHRCPGQHNAGKIDGRLETYDYESVSSQEELDAKLDEGWSKTLREAAQRRRADEKAATEKSAGDKASK